MQGHESVWVFNGERSRLPGGVFGSRAEAEAWIERHGLTGLLTEYPVGVGVYEWAIASGRFTPKRPDQQTGEFIGRFTSASLAHVHYENGKAVS